MNILFVNYGDFTSNSLNHIGGFASSLTEAGHACIVAVPHGKDTVRVISEPRFAAATFAELLEKPNLFGNGRPADIVHAWTPRELVRTFVLEYQRKARARLFIHMEDNEDYLLASWLNVPVESVPKVSEELLGEKSLDGLSHPRRYRAFLGAAEGVTVIVPSLREFVPAGVPIRDLPPGVDFAQYRPLPPDPALRAELGIKPGEKVIVFTGSTTFANEPEMQELYEAVELLNREGVPTRLVRTGITTERFRKKLTKGQVAATIDLGFVDKARLPSLLALADVLVHPGKAGPFNDYRLPSKLPEFLSVGRPVIAPALNVGKELRDSIDALLLKEGTPREMADACKALFADPELSKLLAANSVVFARKRFDLARNTELLSSFYEEALKSAPRPGSTTEITGQETEITLAARALSASLAGTDAHGAADALASLVSDIDGATASSAEQRILRREVEKLQAERDHWQSSDTLSRQHAENLSKALEAAKATEATTSRHIANLEGALAESRKGLDLAIARLAQATQQATQKIDELEGVSRARAEQVAQLKDSLARSQAEVRNREEKIHRMQSSFSWQATSPLRFLRRTLLDKRGTAAATPNPAAPGPSSPNRTYTFDVSHPKTWTTRSDRVLVLGWCFENEGNPIKAIRASVGSQVSVGIYGAKRPDVLAAVGNKPQAEACGFSIEVKLPPGGNSLRLEVQHGDEWVVFFETPLQALGPGDEAGLSDYEQWLKRNEALNESDRRAIAAHIASMQDRPLISVVMPTYNTPVRYLDAAIESVRGQLYPYWELCIADDASSAAETKAALERWKSADRRIKVAFRAENGHICAASNTALELATGGFIALMDHDDLLTENALYEVAAEISRHPDAKLIFSDEDKVDDQGTRFDPYFKPDWNPDLFLGQNFISHLSVYSADAVRSAGGFRKGFEGSQDWDLALRVVESIPESSIRHIPKVLYHWRAIPGSTALVLSEKSYTVEAARRALQEHLDRVKIKAELIAVEGGHWRVRHTLPQEKPLVSLIIPTKNAVGILRQAIDSILAKTSYSPYEIIIVDNNSDDPETLAYFQEVSRANPGKVRVLPHPGPFNYSAINNHAVAESKGTLLGFLNNDVEVISPDWLDEMVSQALRPGIGAVGAMLYYPLNTIQHAGVVLGLGGVAGHPFKQFPRGNEGQMNRLRLVQNYSAVTAACLVVVKERFTKVGGFDEKNLPIAFNDVDLCCKLLKSGLRNLWTPYAEFYHHESATRGAENTPEKQNRFKSEIEYMLATWGDLLGNDPAYNPNLTLVGEDFTRAYAPRTDKPWTRFVSSP